MCLIYQSKPLVCVRKPGQQHGTGSHTSGQESTIFGLSVDASVTVDPSVPSSQMETGWVRSAFLKRGTGGPPTSASPEHCFKQQIPGALTPGQLLGVGSS